MRESEFQEGDEKSVELGLERVIRVAFVRGWVHDGSLVLMVEKERCPMDADRF
jgi:hypothetical protein